MALTTAQKATLKAYILATPALAAVASGPGTDYSFIAEQLSLEASPAFYVWRSSYSPQQMRSAMTVNLGTAQLDGLTPGKRDALLWFIGETVNPSDPAVVATINDFCGTQNTLKASLVDGGKRKALVAEKLLATGTGSLAVPATMGYEGGINVSEIGGILA